jgi:hypothetical protein
LEAETKERLDQSFGGIDNFYEKIYCKLHIMKKTSLWILSGLMLLRICVFAEVASTNGFIAELDQKWVEKDYAGIKNVIDRRLQLKGSQDLVGLTARCDYYSIFDYNPSILLTTANQIKQVKDTLNWTSDKMALEVLNAGIKNYENPQQAQAKGFVFGFSQQQLQELHTEYPNQYPTSQLLQRFSNIQYPSVP